MKRKMRKSKLTKRNLLIALAINLSLMGISYGFGLCIDNAVICTAFWIPIVVIVYFLQSRPTTRELRN